MKAMGLQGRIIGVDIEIRPHNRRAIEAHDLAPYITLIEGDAVSPDVVARVAEAVRPTDKVMVILDSCHTKAHVAKELAAYHHFVTPGSYLLAEDGIMSEVADTPRGTPDWTWDNPTQAVKEFAATHPGFEIGPPPWRFNESALDKVITGWPGGWLRRTTAASGASSGAAVGGESR
jgi:cephalosporin hydroxylase